MTVRAFILVLIPCLAAPASLQGQGPPAHSATEPYAQALGLGIHSLAQPLVAGIYLRRLENLPVGLGVEVARFGVIPQVQLRREQIFAGPFDDGFEFLRADHVSLGLLLSPGGSEFAGHRVTAGSAAVVMLGSQLWPTRMPVPLFMDISAGASVVLAGLDGMPGAAVLLRAYVGVGL